MPWNPTFKLALLISNDLKSKCDLKYPLPLHDLEMFFSNNQNDFFFRPFFFPTVEIVAFVALNSVLLGHSNTYVVCCQMHSPGHLQIVQINICFAGSYMHTKSTHTHIYI